MEQPNPGNYLPTLDGPKIELTFDQTQVIANTGTVDVVVIDPMTEKRYSLVERTTDTLNQNGDPGSDTSSCRETSVEPWKYLVARKHPWRKQLYLKGRNMPVRQLVNSIKVNKLSIEQASANYRLPVEAIQEALSYAAANAELLELEAAQEKYLLAQEGKAHAFQPVP